MCATSLLIRVAFETKLKLRLPALLQSLCHSQLDSFLCKGDRVSLPYPSVLLFQVKNLFKLIISQVNTAEVVVDHRGFAASDADGSALLLRGRRLLIHLLCKLCLFAHFLHLLICHKLCQITLTRLRRLIILLCFFVFFQLELFIDIVQ